MRRTDIDGLRIVICASILLEHALLIFAAEPRYHVKSVEASLVASVFLEFFRATTMPLFFAIAGWSAVVSLRRRSPGAFMLERTLRLLVPLVVGIAVFGSIIKYIELSHGRDMGFHGFRLVDELRIGFFDFFPRNLKYLKLNTWSHLWFLAYLFLISVLLLPLLVRLARSTPRANVPVALVVYLPALPMIALLIAFNGYWPYLPNLLTDWNNFAYYALCFAIGAGIAAWPGFEMQLQAEAPRLLVLALLAFAGLVLSWRILGWTPVCRTDRMGEYRREPWLCIPHQADRNADAHLSQRGDHAGLHRAPCPIAVARYRGAIAGDAGMAQGRPDLVGSGHGFAGGLSLAHQAMAPDAGAHGHDRPSPEHKARIAAADCLTRWGAHVV